jgi:hypothetical protein
MTSFLRFIFIAAFLFMYFVAIILLKPMRFHIKRKYSTIFLKVTYLIYLATFLIFTYLFLFYNGSSLFYLEDPDNPRAFFHFTLLLLSFFIPNTGILIRRSIKKRTIYNVAVGIVNIIFGIYLLILIEKTI